MFLFADKDQNKEYDKWREALHLKQVRIVSFVTASLYLLMSFIDRIIAPEEILPQALFLHLYVLPPLLYSVSFLAFTQKFYSFMIRLLMFVTIIAAIGNFFIINQLGYYSPYHAEVYLIIFWVFTISGLKLRDATITATIIVLTVILGTLYYRNLVFSEIIMYSFWITASFSFGLVGAFLLESSGRKIFSQQKELEKELSNKNILLKELAHRVKNNLQIVSGILYSQSKKIEEKETKEIFDNSIQTIKAMGMIHEKLYQSQNLDSIDFKEYIEHLITLSKQNLNNKQVQFSFDSKSIVICIESAVPLGLIVNEIITNSLKYAVTKDKQDILISITMSINDAREILLHISDNGEGLDFDKQVKGFGTQLIHSLVSYQLKGEISAYNKDGLHYEIKFTNDKQSSTLIY